MDQEDRALCCYLREAYVQQGTIIYLMILKMTITLTQFMRQFVAQHCDGGGEATGYVGRESRTWKLQEQLF